MLNIGDRAPNFKLLDKDGVEHSLEDYRGKKVILYFYPKDNTPGCTNQACSLRDNYNTISGKNAVVIGISSDTEVTHSKFIEKFGLPFVLLSDKDKEIVKLYGAWGEKKNYGKIYFGLLRMTFIIDEEGIITKILEKVSVKTHGEDVLQYL